VWARQNLRWAGALVTAGSLVLLACAPGDGDRGGERPASVIESTTTLRESTIASLSRTTIPPSTTTLHRAEVTTSTTSVVVPAVTTTAATSTSTTTTTTSATTTTSTTEPVGGQIDGGAVPGDGTVPDAPALASTEAAFDRLAASAEAASITVIRDGRTILARATGRTIAGDIATSDTPMVIASVSKMMTALAISRLAQTGPLDLDEPVPWAFLGLDPNPGWYDVTPRDLLGHAAGMPVVRTSWFTGGGSCASYLPALIAQPPRGHRGTWTYSNGNYCALGLLVEFLTGHPLDGALAELVFDPAGLSPAHLADDGQTPDDIAHRRGVARLSRLGGAGNLIASTDSVAGALARLTPADYLSLHLPGGFIDQYGFGHTGTVGGAVACAWVLEGGRTVFAMTISGERPATGGAVCDTIEPALGSDLGFWAGTPTRSSI
jgi:D-alanyl-D-alanine carboxypeptidase